MSIYRSRKMQPRNGHTLVVLVAARISGCQSQKDVSLEDQEEHAREVIEEIYDQESVDFRVIATRGKGESLERPELGEIELMIRTREIDVLILEDLGRLVRGTEANRLCGIAVDHGTRVIAVHDCIDTWEDGWEEDVIAACRDHVGHNVHTSKRIKKKSMLRFRRYGAATANPIAGYIKPDDAETYFDWLVDPDAIPIVRQGAQLLRETMNCCAVADYFESVRFPVGPYCRRETWDGKMVRRFYSNPLLKGKPERGNKHSVKHHETGRRRSVRNPEGPVSIEVPKLAILSDVEFDELNALLEEKNRKLGRPYHHNGHDCRKDVQRKRTRFPGQHARCWYCGRHYVWGGNGITEHLQCSGSRDLKCWNSMGLKGLIVNEKVVQAIVGMLSEMEGFEEQFRQIVEDVQSQPDTDNRAESDRIRKDEARLKREVDNLLDAIAEFGPKPALRERLEKTEAEQRNLAIQRAQIERKTHSDTKLPETYGELRQIIEEQFLALAIRSHDFGQMMPKIVPQMYVYLVRMADGGPLLPRVKFQIDLSGAFPNVQLPDALKCRLMQWFTVDIFDLPVRERIRSQAAKLRAEGLTFKQILNRLGIRTSEKAIADAIALNEQMKCNELDSPLVFQSEPPTDIKKMKRYRHPRYRFEPLDGYERPDI